jgi:hypothetical protein
LATELRPEFSETSWIDGGKGRSPFLYRGEAIPNLPVKRVTAFVPFIADGEVSVKQKISDTKYTSDKSSNNSSRGERNQMDDLVHICIVFWILIMAWYFAGLPIFPSSRRPKDERFD